MCSLKVFSYFLLFCIEQLFGPFVSMPSIAVVAAVYCTCNLSTLMKFAIAIGGGGGRTCMEGLQVTIRVL